MLKSKFASIPHRCGVLISISVIDVHEKCLVRKLRLLREKSYSHETQLPADVCCRVPCPRPCPTFEVEQTAIKTANKVPSTLQCEPKVGTGRAEILIHFLKVTLGATG